MMAIGVIGLSLFPPASLLYFTWQSLADFAPWIKVLCFSLLLAPAFFIFGIGLCIVGVAMKTLLRFKIKPGLYRLYEDWAVIHWMGYNTFILIVNGCFMNGLRMSPLQTLFYRAMGARIGQSVRINTAGLADLSLIEIGDDTLIGDGVTMICHAVDRGFCYLGSVKIGKNVSIGLDTIILPDTVIEDGAVIGPRSYLPKGTRIPAKGHFGGMPLKDLREERRQKSSSSQK